MPFQSVRAGAVQSRTLYVREVSREELMACGRLKQRPQSASEPTTPMLLADRVQDAHQDLLDDADTRIEVLPSGCDLVQLEILPQLSDGGRDYERDCKSQLAERRSLSLPTLFASALKFYRVLDAPSAPAGHRDAWFKVSVVVAGRAGNASDDRFCLGQQSEFKALTDIVGQQPEVSAESLNSVITAAMPQFCEPEPEKPPSREDEAAVLGSTRKANDGFRQLSYVRRWPFRVPSGRRASAKVFVLFVVVFSLLIMTSAVSKGRGKRLRGLGLTSSIVRALAVKYGFKTQMHQLTSHV
eukprot:CAMPEP_0204184810 /NCGR_PEP_ID=MMETSP0361-20130328/54744_1 /ASSEMBLY_ACC=CAM_ASM_000343 /TAXON_ID=268821 /ORGANISM="Scrippsiella Hangoei, Strain SHTV-5" /LENGTH=297 /DNA_ID=CAMNT_0051144893 /DNA_START=194 /DNA_END=1084 /DNA_ORIENTATION=-